VQCERAALGGRASPYHVLYVPYSLDSGLLQYFKTRTTVELHHAIAFLVTHQLHELLWPRVKSSV